MYGTIVKKDEVQPSQPPSIMNSSIFFSCRPYITSIFSTVSISPGFSFDLLSMNQWMNCIIISIVIVLFQVSVIKPVFIFTASKTEKTENKTGEPKKPKTTGKKLEENTNLFDVTQIFH